MLQSFSVGPLQFHGYGFVMGMAMMIGWWWASRLWKRWAGNRGDFDVIGWWALSGGLIGARLYHVIDYWWYYRFHIGEVMAVWQGGLAIWGAVLGGILSLGYLSWRKRLPLRLVLDVMAATLPLSQAIGRWGNWINYELYGKPTTLPWGWWIPPGYRPEQMMLVERYHPLFLYESLLSLGLFMILSFCLTRLRVGSGTVLGMYLMGYGVIRFFLEFLRIDPWSICGFPVASIVSFGAIVIGIWLMVHVGYRYENVESHS